MDRRAYLSAFCTASVATVAGCSGVGESETLSEPTVDRSSDGRGVLRFAADGEEIGSVGVDGDSSGSHIDLSTEIWHRDGTNVESIRLRVWMAQPDSDTPPAVGLISPVEGDSSPPPTVTLSTPDQAPGTVIEVTDLDDLADETISTLNFIVDPRTATATTLGIHATIELTEGGLFGTDYTLDGELRLGFPELEPSEMSRE